MPTTEDLARWRTIVARLVAGPAPRGETFDLCRSVLTSPAPAAERAGAARLLLEGAMADALTDIGDAQEVMRILRALGSDELAAPDILDR